MCFTNTTQLQAGARAASEGLFTVGDVRSIDLVARLKILDSEDTWTECAAATEQSSILPAFRSMELCSVHGSAFLQRFLAAKQLPSTAEES